MRSTGMARGRSIVVGVATLGALALPAATSGATGSFVDRADAGCTTAGQKIEKLPTKATVGQIDSELAIVSGLVRQLRALTPPSAAAAQFKQFLAQTERQVHDVRGAVAAAKKKQPRTVARDLNATAVAGQESNATAADIGLRACARNYSPKGS
jgi:conjugal transfer/entry exclusion protein